MSGRPVSAEYSVSVAGDEWLAARRLRLCHDLMDDSSALWRAMQAAGAGRCQAMSAQSAGWTIGQRLRGDITPSQIIQTTAFD